MEDQTRTVEWETNTLCRATDHSRMTTPLEKIIAILLPGTKKRETSEKRFEAIWSQLKLLGWKATKCAKKNCRESRESTACHNR